MKRKSVLIVFVLILSLLLATVAFAQTFPGAGTPTTNAVLQNQGTTAATVAVTYYGADGTMQLTDSVSIEPNAVVEVKTEDAALPAGFAGAAIVSSDQPLASVVSIKSTGVSASAGSTTQAAYNGTSAPANTILFPSVWRFSGIASKVTIQNTEGTATTATASFFDRDGNSLGSADIPLGAYGSYTIDMRNIGLSGVNWPDSVADGSITVTAGNMLAGASTAAWTNRAGAYQALTSNNQGSVLYAPSHYRFQGSAPAGEYTLFSAINIQNTDADNDANITVEYFTRGDSSGTPALSFNTTVPAGSAIGLNTKNGASVPANTFNPLGTDWDGSVKVTSLDDIPLVGTGITNWGVSGYTGMYALVSANDSGSTIFVPAQYRRNPGSWAQWSAINLQNIGSTTVTRADLTVKYIDTAGNVLATFTGSDLPSDLAAGAAFGLNTRNGGDLTAGDFTSLGDNFIGGILVEGPVGSELVAVNNIIYSNRASTYNGIPK